MLITNNISKYFLVPVLMIVFTSCFKREQGNDPMEKQWTEMTFNNKLGNLGKISEGKSVDFSFEFYNSGKNPLIIKDVSTSCGCTVAQWPKGAIKPQEKATIKIAYDAKYPGRFSKTITVVYNGKNSPLELTIIGEVPYPVKRIKRTNQ